MQASEYITVLEGQITETERRLERLRLKLEVAREVAVELDKGDDATQANPLPDVEVPNVNNKYHGLLASDAILRFLTDRGVSSRKTILDALEGQIRTKSDKPRNIVRNCLAQLAEREKVEIDSQGNVSLKASEA